jgi:hypothetical protein
MPLPSNRSQSDLREGLSLLRRALSFTSEIASKFEQGRNHSPIGEFLSNLEKDLKRAFLAVLLIEPGAEEREISGSDSLEPGGASFLPVEDLAIAKIGVNHRLSLLSHLLGQAGLVVTGTAKRGNAPTAEALLTDHSASLPPGWIDLTGAYREREGPFGPPGASSSLVGMLKDSSSPLRSALAAAHQARRLEAMIGLLTRLVDGEERTLEARRQVMNHHKAVLKARLAGLKGTMDALRREGKGFELRVRAELAECHERRKLPSSAGQKRIRNHLQGLSEGVLTRESTGHDLCFKVRASVSQNAVRLLRAQVREDFEADLATSRSRLEEEARTISTRVASITGSTELINALPPEGSNLWGMVEKRIQLDFVFSDKVLQRGWLALLMDLIAQGWRLPRTAMMLLSAFGFVSFSHGPLHFVLGPVLIGSVAWTCFDFRHVRRKQIDDVMAKVREKLGIELQKLCEHLVNVAQKGMVDELVASRAKLEDRAERRLQDWSREDEGASEQDMEKLGKEMESVEDQSRRLQAFPESLRRARQAVTESRQALEGVSADLLDGWRATAEGPSP